MATAPAEALPARLGSADLQGLAVVARLLSRLGDFESLLASVPDDRDNCLHFGYSEAARRLNVKEKWLRERISQLPHRKFGKFVQFTEDDLRAISDMHFVQPGSSVADSASASTPALVPSGRSRRRS